MAAKGQFGVRGIVDGKKRCNGPLHNGEYVEISRFLPRKRKRNKDAYYEARCRGCMTKSRGFNPKYAGIVSLPTAWPVYVELVRRLGITEASRRTHTQKTVFYRVINKQGHYIRGKTFAKAMFVLADVRKHNEVRHRRDIKRGAYLRGKKERRPVHLGDFNNQSSDAENERRIKERSKKRKLRGKDARPASG
jgi:hypothetical protein